MYPPLLEELMMAHGMGVQLIEQISHIYTLQGYKTEILAASIRNALHIVRCAEVGAGCLYLSRWIPYSVC
jgi:transaldolase